MRQPATSSLLIELVVLLLLMTIVPGPARADLWYEHYAAAEKALAEGRWSEAVEQLNSALEKKGDSGARARTYGMKFTTYFPYLKLGIAYYELGRLDAALQAFETEERLGAIAQSEPDRTELERYRKLARELQVSAVEEEAERVQRVVRESLASANRLETLGDIEGAIAALGPALAVSPEEPNASAALQRLRAQLGRQQERAELRNRASTLVERGRDLLDQGLAAEASSVLRQALALGENSDASALLEQVQERLRAEAEQQSQSIAQGLDQALELERTGRLEEALEHLQPILALDPDNRDARELEQALLDKKAQADQSRLRSDAVEGFISDAEEALAAGLLEDALAAANRTLAVDTGNQTALDQLARAYRAINRRLLGDGTRQNFPPAIRFANQRQELPDGAFAELVRQSGFRLTGVVIDDSPVTVEFFTSDEQQLEVSATTQALGDLFITEFQLSHDLQRGPNSLQLIATDAENLTSSAEYAVVYSRRWFQSPWFYGSLAIVLAAVVASSGLVRARRKRRLHQRRFNPYMAGAPVLDEKLFFGREQLLEKILQTLHNNSLLLHGERRIGKTSLQHQLKKRLEALRDPVYDFYPVYIDLQGTPEELFFATLGEEIFEELAGVLDGFEPSSPFSSDYTYRDLVADLREILKRLRRREPTSLKRNANISLTMSIG